jgi:DNA-binding ferritin-like protein
MPNEPKTVEAWLSFDGSKTAYLDASPEQKAVFSRYLCGVLAVLRAQYLSYQTSHWQVVGGSFYGNHLLFERLYKSVEEQVDQLAEKIVGFLGGEAVGLVYQMEKIHMLCGQWGRISCNHKRGLQSEADLQQAIKIAYEAITQEGMMSLGLDDWLMATANEHESNTYLLQQALAPIPGEAK